MQKIGAYLLERREGMEWPEARAEEAKRIHDEVGNWLRSKGAEDISRSGTFAPEDGSKGTYTIQTAADTHRTWWMVKLQEDNAEGRRFSTAVSITNGRDRVSVYVTLETGWITTRIMPVPVDPKCPRIVRSLLGLPGRWYHGGSPIRLGEGVNGFDEGESLALEIQNPNRTIPVVVVSTDGNGPALPDLDAKLGHDLAGLADVVIIDDDATWALTDILGKSFSCYRGSVRLYWPQFSTKQQCYSHPLWTAERLRSTADNPISTRDIFRKQLRGQLFRAAALSVLRPREIDEIRDAGNLAAISSLRQRATTLEGYKELADSYAAANDELRSERDELLSQVEQLESQVVRLEGDKQALLAHLQQARDGATADEIPPEANDISDGADAPKPGEIRYYKKKFSRHTHDVLVRVADCGCNNWQGAHAADKARKGVMRLENGRSDWKTMFHCASCTGGGMWKVRW